MFTIENTALVLVDHQVGTIDWAGGITPEQRDQVKTWARFLARFAKGAGIPIVLTSSMEDQAQGVLLPEFQQIIPEEYERRVRRAGVINAWDDPNFVQAVQATQRPNLLLCGVTTEICLVPPALSAKQAGYNVICLFDASAPNTITGENSARIILNQAGVEVYTSLPVMTAMLGTFNRPEAGIMFQAMGEEGIIPLLAQGQIR